MNLTKIAKARRAAALFLVLAEDVEREAKANPTLFSGSSPLPASFRQSSIDLSRALSDLREVSATSGSPRKAVGMGWMEDDQ
jgi:hypothetical protein